ncbi:MAG: tetratricopeptide repeat protein [Chloroflexi bacterium]|nr:tetratricopeptide repeat protein [Chloroflexota bacterium]
MDKKEIAIRSGDWEEAEPIARQALNVSVSDMGKENPVTVSQMIDLALVLAKQDKPDESISLYNSAREIIGRTRMRAPQRFTDLLFALGEILAKNPEDKGEILSVIIGDLEKKVGGKNPSLAMLYYHAGKSYCRNYSLPEAAQYLEKALKAAPDGDLFPEDVMYLLGETYEEQDKADLGLPYLEKSLGRTEKKFGNESKEAKQVKSTLLELYRQERQFDKAEETGKELIAGDENPQDGDLLPLFRDLTDMGKVYLAMRRPDLAQPYCERAIKLAETYQNDDTDRAVLHRFEARVNMAELYTLQGKYDKALDEFKKSRGLLARRIEQYPEEKYNRTVSLTYIFEALEAAGIKAYSDRPTSFAKDYNQRVVQLRNATIQGDIKSALMLLDGLIEDYPMLFSDKKNRSEK